uniref:Mitogen-activated protein kinase-binding protein 1-like n=1 Tax=Saccoglossus kowalevskii TaxID=10224 RepID=A0ABM0M972_SACKO|nr:PREDICTED: mitogen-activated protein kinase-binding protein 1-like [Saccoglossus kowalevskii]
MDSDCTASVVCDRMFNPRKNKQTHIFNHSRKTITALALSPDGKYVVTGESGHMPAVRVWDVAERSQVGEFAGHKFGISCVAFSPNLKHVVSVGSQHDMVVNVWDWKTGIRAASNKISCKVTAICFNETGNCFVTVGTRNVRFWYTSSKKVHKSREAVPLHGRSGILGEQRNNFFCDVACGKGSNKEKTFCITTSGLLCEFDEKRLLDKWVELRTPQAHSLSVSEKYIFVGCANGVIRIFSADTLHYVSTLPKPHILGVNVAASMDPSHLVKHNDNAKYPAAVALTLDDKNNRLSAVYNDHSLYVWDVRDIKKIGKSWSFLYHSAPVWGIDVYPNIPDGNKSLLPAGSFITCSSDNTIRVWNINEQATSTDGTFKRNIFSELSGHDNAKTDAITVEDKKGVRCTCVDHSGQHIAAGDRSGNIHIYDFNFSEEICQIEAHDAEVLCLTYSKPETGYVLLASASRDRLIHVFNVKEDYKLMQTLDDHSSSITAVKFTVAYIHTNPDLQFIRTHHLNGKTTLYDMSVDATQKFVVAACQDRNLRIYNIASGKQKRCYKGSVSDDGTLIRVELDPAGVYATTSCSDKTICVYDFYAGECVATMLGHSELVTGIRFTHDSKHLITVSGDGCVFVWKLPIMFTQHMKERMAELGKVQKVEPAYNMLRRGTYTAMPKVIPGMPAPVPDTTDGDSVLEQLLSEPFMSSTETLLQEEGSEQTNNVSGEEVLSPNTYSSPSQPKGRWAQRVDAKGFRLKSEWEDQNAIQLSMASCMDRRRLTVEPDTLYEQKLKNSLTGDVCKESDVIAEDDIEDEDEEFLPAGLRLPQLEQQLAEDEIASGRVTKSRGSDPFICPFVRPETDGSNNSESPSTPDREVAATLAGALMNLENSEEDDEKDDDKEVIIYLPSEEESAKSENGEFCVTENVESMKMYAKRFKKVPRSSSAERKMSLESTESDSTDKMGIISVDNSDEDDEERPDTPFEEQKDEQTDDEEKEKVFLKNNYENLAEEKFETNIDQLEVTGNSYMQQLQSGRLSISTRFLTRAQQNHLRRLAAAALERDNISSDEASESEDDSLQKRQQEMARAVEETRRRLQEMGYGAGSKKKTSPEEKIPGTLRKRSGGICIVSTEPEIQVPAVTLPQDDDSMLSDNKDENELSNVKTQSTAGIGAAAAAARVVPDTLNLSIINQVDSVTKPESMPTECSAHKPDVKSLPTKIARMLPSPSSIASRQASAEIHISSSMPSLETTQSSPPQHIANKENIVDISDQSPRIQRSRSRSESGKIGMKDLKAGKFESKSETSSPTHTMTLRKRSKSQDSLDRAGTTSNRNRAARRARTERHLPPLPISKSHSAPPVGHVAVPRTRNSFSGETESSQAKRTQSYAAGTKSSLAKINQADSATSSPRTLRKKSYPLSPEHKDNDESSKTTKDSNDRFVMPPPSTNVVNKTKTTSRRSYSDPKSRNYSKARRFPPNSPKKDSRSLTISDPSSISKLLESKATGEGTAVVKPPINGTRDKTQKQTLCLAEKSKISEKCDEHMPVIAESKQEIKSPPQQLSVEDVTDNIAPLISVTTGLIIEEKAVKSVKHDKIKTDTPNTVKTGISEIQCSNNEPKAEENKSEMATAAPPLTTDVNSPTDSSVSLMTMALCTKTAEELQHVFSKAVQLHSQVLNETYPEQEKTQMLSALQSTFTTMQETLTNIEPTLTNSTPKQSPTSLLTQDEVSKLKTSIALTNGKREDPQVAEAAISLLDQYSDMLVSLVKQKIAVDNTPT